MRGQGGQRPSADGLAGDRGGSGQRLTQQAKGRCGARAVSASRTADSPLIAVAVASASSSRPGQVRGQDGQRLRTGGLAGDRGGSGQRLAQSAGSLIRRQVRDQGGQRLRTGRLAADRGGGSQRLAQGAGSLIWRQVRGQGGQRPSAADSPVIAVAVASAWSSRSGEGAGPGRSALERGRDPPLIAVAAASAWPRARVR